MGYKNAGIVSLVLCLLLMIVDLLLHILNHII